jgi:hypothetical protein
MKEMTSRWQKIVLSHGRRSLKPTGITIASQQSNVGEPDAFAKLEFEWLGITQQYNRGIWAFENERKTADHSILVLFAKKNNTDINENQRNESNRVWIKGYRR